MTSGPADGTTSGIDFSRPHPARVYDYYLGGKDHFAVDRETAERTYREGGMTLRARTASELRRLAFSGLELVPPGVVLVSEWRPDGDDPRPQPADVGVYGAVARKPAAAR